MFEFFGHTGKVEDPKTFFSNENYIICRGSTNIEKLDELFAFYNKYILTSDKLYLRQSKKWEANKYTEAGGIGNAFLQPHSYTSGINGEFSDKILSVLCDDKIQKALFAISEINNYSLAQTMFFDHKTTRPHQDWIYLDTKPNGYLIAAWVALEDIHEDGIRFFVYPGSQHFQPQLSYKQGVTGTDIFNDFLKEIDEVLSTNKYEMYAPSLKKGDIFFWGSRIIHGSVAGVNPSLRRRSLAAHFLPNGFKFGNLQEEIPIQFREKYNLKYRFIDYLDKDFARQNNISQSISINPLKKWIKDKLINRR